MTKYENELFDILRGNEDPGQAILTALKVFSAFAEQLEATPVPLADDLQVSS